jgi:hypothetical protein
MDEISNKKKASAYCNMLLFIIISKVNFKGKIWTQRGLTVIYLSEPVITVRGFSLKILMISFID